VTTSATLEAAIEPLLRQLYPSEHQQVCRRFIALAEEYASRFEGRMAARPTHASAVLITYGDSIRRPNEKPLHTLSAVLREQVHDAVTDVHLLPMYPWTSDDGFAVMDHRQVNPDLGTWADVSGLADDYGLMFDFVANHMSAASPWFRGWLAGDDAYADYFIERDPEFDASHVVRPRTTALFHDYARPDGSSVSAWTTFGRDQVDVDVATPAALIELTDVLLGYLEQGASAIRLDAIGFLWKESGTSCLHLPQTHAIIKLWRALVDHVAAGTQLLTETNVPHAENIAYFGNGADEAHLVYQFALPPLVLHTFVSGRTTTLSRWAADIGAFSPSATWFNFLASHDGIGLRPTEGILTDDERQSLVERTLAHGGRVSMATRPDGTQTVYELNVGYIDALATTAELADDATVAAKALAAHSILLAFLGVPAIYYHSLFGSRPDRAGMEVSGMNRRINREVLDADQLVHELRHDTRRRAVFEGLVGMLALRRQQPAFSPYGLQCIETFDPRVFVVRRGEGTEDELVCVTNVTAETVIVPEVEGVDVLTGQPCRPLRLAAYGYAWVSPRT